MYEIISWIVFGFFAGIVAKLLTPGKDPGGFIVTILLGIAGSVLGGFCARLLGLGAESWVAGFVLAVIGAMLLLLLYRLMRRQA